MLPEYFALVGSAIAVSGSLFYLYCTIKGTVKPNRVTWFFWGLFPMIGFAAQISQGVGLVVWATFVAGFIPFLVFIAATFNLKAYWEIKKIDYIFAGIGVFSLLLWYVTQNPNLALTFAVLADFAVAVPTLLKVWNYPETETWKTYALGTVGFGIGVLSIQTWTYENYAFVIYLFLVNLLLASLALRKSTPVTI
ncbi:hypothetical protein N8083_01630 [Candidatus Pacebacteria bacterium]|nr:hypothetical protein [Candidatus Paceibacterota bacterium]